MQSYGFKTQVSRTKRQETRTKTQEPRTKTQEPRPKTKEPRRKGDKESGRQREKAAVALGNGSTQNIEL
jgi:hypothetical protein